MEEMDKKYFFPRLKIIYSICLLFFICAQLIQVQADAAPKIRLNRKNVTLVVGETLKLKMNGTIKKVQWKSSKKSVASVSVEGEVKAKKAGTATIIAQVGNKKYNCKLKVLKQTTFGSLNGKNLEYQTSEYLYGIDIDKRNKTIFLGIWWDPNYASVDDYMFKYKEGKHKYVVQSGRSNGKAVIELYPTRNAIKVKLKSKYFNISAIFK